MAMLTAYLYLLTRSRICLGDGSSTYFFFFSDFGTISFISAGCTIKRLRCFSTSFTPHIFIRDLIICVDDSGV